MTIEARGPMAGPADDVPGVLGALPRLDRLQVRLARRLERFPIGRTLRASLGSPGDPEIEAGPPEIRWRGSGLRRPGVIAELSWPRLGSRLALGVDTPLAHALVDHLLGFDRFAGEERLQVTPVEWGVLAYLAARALSDLAARPGPLGPWDLELSRVGPDPFDPEGLGAIATVRWPARVGPVMGGLRLWVPVALIGPALAAEWSAPSELAADSLRGRFGELAGSWRAVAGTATLPRGFAVLRPGVIVPIDGNPLKGVASSPSGPVALMLDDASGRCTIPAEPTPGTAAARLTIVGPPRREPSPREPLAVNPDPSPPSPESAPGRESLAPADVPVTLIVELGRVALPLRRLADLKPGDVIELGRHAREPVELTSNGRLVARGELVQIDTELGVRITNVFL